MVIPTLETDRLTLRAPAQDDFPVYRAFYDDEQASAFYGGPMSAPSAWRKLAGDIGHWALRGYGMWSIVDKASGRMVGSCGLVWPEGWPRHELTWWIIPDARRQGRALEASRAAIDWGYEALGWAQVETHMDDDNGPARGLALALGGIVIARETFPDGHPRDVYRLPRSDIGLAARADRG